MPYYYIVRHAEHYEFHDMHGNKFHVWSKFQEFEPKCPKRLLVFAVRNCGAWFYMHDYLCVTDVTWVSVHNMLNACVNKFINVSSPVCGWPLRKSTLSLIIYNCKKWKTTKQNNKAEVNKLTVLTYMQTTKMRLKRQISTTTYTQWKKKKKQSKTTKIQVDKCRAILCQMMYRMLCANSSSNVCLIFNPKDY